LGVAAGGTGASATGRFGTPPGSGWAGGSSPDFLSPNSTVGGCWSDRPAFGFFVPLQPSVAIKPTTPTITIVPLNLISIHSRKVLREKPTPTRDTIPLSKAIA
jgi:hypothetical protein